VQILFLHLWLFHICSYPVGKSSTYNPTQIQYGQGLPNDLDAGNGTYCSHFSHEKVDNIEVLAPWLKYFNIWESGTQKRKPINVTELDQSEGLVQIKTTKRYHLSPVRMAIVKNARKYSR